MNVNQGAYIFLNILSDLKYISFSLTYNVQESTTTVGFVLEFEIWRLKGITDLISW